MKPISHPGPEPTVSIIIPVFNKIELTVQCLSALISVTTGTPYEIIVVDNGSTDGTAAGLKGFEGKVRLLRNELNTGFAAACNQGAAAAKGKYLLFLNNDTIPLKGWLEELAVELRNHPEVVAAGSKLLYENGLVQHAGVAFQRHTRNACHPYRSLRQDAPAVNHRREVQAVTAACLIVRAKRFHECGRFHEGYRNGYEDLDLCLALRRSGGVIVYQPKSVLFHLESQTPGRYRFDNENRALFFERWRGAVLSDEDAFYYEDGFRIQRSPEDRAEKIQLIKLDCGEDRARWSVLARAQRLAAAGKTSDLAQLLAETEKWPADAMARQWAGVLCQRLGLAAASEKHFAVSLTLAADPELRVQMALNSCAVAGDPKAGWETFLIEGHRKLSCNDCAGAREQFELALVSGAPPRLTLPGLSRASERPDDVLLGAIGLLPRINEEAINPPAAAAPQPKAGGLVSIIILAHNQLTDTQQCLASIEKHTSARHELILVDNGSTDGTTDFFHKYAASHAHARIIVNHTNLGFAAGNNQALACAQGDAVLFLNNDTVVTPGWLERMLAVFDLFPECGLTGPVSNSVSGPQQVPSPTYSKVDQLPRFAAQWSAAHSGKSVEAARLVGFCLLARRTVVEKIGGLDPQFGSGNFEDDDFCIRAGLAGFKLRIAFDSFVHHTGGQTFKGAKIDYRTAMLRNWNLFKDKWDFPKDTLMEKGYRLPTVAPGGVSLRIPLRDLRQTHAASLESRCWTDKASPETAAKKPALPAAKPLPLPPCALLGRLGEALELRRNKQGPAAWAAVLAALSARPYHPEAYLMLAEIAQTAGDSNSARRCAKAAREMAPEWVAPKQFLKGNLRGNSTPSWLKLPEALSEKNAAVAPRLSVCVIARNEERFLPQCLGSVRALASQIVFMDTGSTDRTIEIAREFGAEIYHFAWNDDFSAARNAALEHATGDWVLVIDADEELRPEQVENLRQEMQREGVLGYRLPITNEGREQEGCSYVPRLFRNAPGLFFIGRVHEQVFSSIQVRCGQWGLKHLLGKTTLFHHGYTDEVVASRSKVQRNLRLLQRATEEMPNEPNLIMNLGLELARSGQLEAGLKSYWEAFQIMAASPSTRVTPEGRETLLTQLTSYLLAAKRYSEIVELWRHPFASGGGLTASQHFALGLAHQQLKQFSEAVEQMRQCLAKRGQPALSPVFPESLKAAPHHCLACCLTAVNDLPAARQAFEAALRDDPSSRIARFDFARFESMQGRTLEALKILGQLVAENSKELHVWQFGGQLALSRLEDLPFACQWTEKAAKQFPHDRLVLQQRAEALMLSQEIEKALPWWRAAAPSPSQRAAMVLCEVLTDDGNYPIMAAEEPVISREAIRWYREWIRVSAHSTILQVHERMEAIRLKLPTFVRTWEKATDQARAAAA